MTSLLNWDILFKKVSEQVITDKTMNDYSTAILKIKSGLSSPIFLLNTHTTSAIA